jgi:hypothetical protein
MSSSRSGQWSPSPCPINRQFFRSAAVACTSRGNHSSGTVIVRPSAKLTAKLFSVIAISVTGMSAVEVLIPTPQQNSELSSTSSLIRVISVTGNPPLTCNLTGSSQNFALYHRAQCEPCGVLGDHQNKRKICRVHSARSLASQHNIGPPQNSPDDQ